MLWSEIKKEIDKILLGQDLKDIKVSYIDIEIYTNNHTFIKLEPSEDGKYSITSY